MSSTSDVQSYYFHARTFFQCRSVVDIENKYMFTLLGIKYLSICFVVFVSKRYFQVLLKQRCSAYNPFRYFFSIDIGTVFLSKGSSYFRLLNILFLIVKENIYLSMYLSTYHLSIIFEVFLHSKK